MITIVSLCADTLHEREYVKPLLRIIKPLTNVQVISVKELTPQITGPLVFSGTALADNEYLEYIDELSWLKTYTYPVYGICAGMQLLSLIHGSTLTEDLAIGMLDVHDISEQLLHGVQQAFFLHQHNVSLAPTLTCIANANSTVAAYKHKTLPHYGTLFHPEVRNEHIIVRFIKIAIKTTRS